MENLYTTLSKTPCGSYIEGKKQKLTEKQKQRFLSGTTIHEVHRLLGTAFQYAVEWGILVKSPVPVDSPKKSTQERTIWTVEEMRAALDSMEDPILHLAVHLTLVGALREGEIVGLTPEDIDFDAADGIGTFLINKSMQRVRKEALNQVDDGCIIKVFPGNLSADDLRRRCEGCAGHHRTRYGGYAGEHLRPYPAVLSCRTGQEVRGRFLRQTGKPQPAGCTRRRRTDHLYDCSAGTAEKCRPRSKGAAPSGSADLMQNLPRISKQFQPMQRIPTKKPTVH